MSKIYLSIKVSDSIYAKNMIKKIEKVIKNKYRDNDFRYDLINNLWLCYFENDNNTIRIEKIKAFSKQHNIILL